MNNHLNPDASACAQSIPHVYTVKTVRKHLKKKAARYLARPLYSGPPVSVTLTLTDVIMDPQFESICNTKPFEPGHNTRAFFRRFLGEFGCDTVRLDGRVLPVEGTEDHMVDFARVCLLKDNKPVFQKLILPEGFDSSDTFHLGYYLEVSKAGATNALDQAGKWSRSFLRKGDKPYSCVKADMDAVLWVSEETASAPSFIVPLKKSASAAAEPVAPVSRQVATFPDAALARTEATDGRGSTRRPHADVPSLLPTGTNILSECRQVRHVGDLLPWLDKEVTYIGSPVLNGHDFSIVLTNGDFKCRGGMEAAIELRNQCHGRAAQLQDFFSQVTSRLPGDRLRLDGRMVPEPDGSYYPCIYRVVVLNAGQPVGEYPYVEQIFETDADFDRHLVAWLSAETVDTSLQILRKLASATAYMGRTGSEPFDVSGVLWLPVNQDRFRPSFHTECQPHLLTDDEAGLLFQDLFQKRISDVYVVRNLEIAPWR